MSLKSMLKMALPTIATLAVLKAGRNLPGVRQVRDFVL